MLPQRCGSPACNGWRQAPTRPAGLAVRCVVLAMLTAKALAYTESPLIGVVSEPCLPGVCGPPVDADDTSYIAASYVKFVESAGARAVALVYNEDKAELMALLVT